MPLIRIVDENSSVKKNTVPKSIHFLERSPVPMAFKGKTDQRLMDIENELGRSQLERTPTPSFGAEMRELRKVRGLTLKTLSEGTGISLSYLSLIERDAANPSTEVLTGIAKALGVDVSWFFMSRQGKGPREHRCVVRKDARRNLNLLYGTPSQEVGYSDMLLSGSIGGAFYLAMCTFAPGAKNPDKPMISHEGEQHAVVLKGAIELTLDDEVITLWQGDSYSFDTRVRHNVRNALSDAETVIVWAVTHVVIPRDQELKANQA